MFCAKKIKMEFPTLMLLYGCYILFKCDVKAYCWHHYHQQLVSHWCVKFDFGFEDLHGFSSQLLWACSFL